jgi:O-antigen/teichoic acid export membrane protein
VLTPLLPTGWPKGFVSYSVRTLVAGLVASLVFSRCEVLVLDAYGLVGQAGLFALAAGIAGQITAPIDAMLGPLVPAAASLVATDEARAAFAIQRGVRLSALVTVPVLALVVPTLALLTPVIYGGRFHGVGLMFVALGLVSCVQSALHPATAFLGAVRRPLTVLGFNAMALVVDLTVVVLLAPMIGASAAVIATSAGQLTSLMLGIELLRRRLAMPVRPIIAAMRPLVLVSLVAAGSVALVLELPVGAIPGSAMALALAATGTWLVVRLSGGIVPQSDLDAVAAALPSRLQVATTVARRLGLVR